jgi:hypothetical protein
MPLRILLIDTDPERGRALEEKLSQSGFAEVLRAPEGPDLADTVERIPPSPRRRSQPGSVPTTSRAWPCRI